MTLFKVEKRVLPCKIPLKSYGYTLCVPVQVEETVGYYYCFERDSLGRKPQIDKVKPSICCQYSFWENSNQHAYMLFIDFKI